MFWYSPYALKATTLSPPAVTQCNSLDPDGGLQSLLLLLLALLGLVAHDTTTPPFPALLDLLQVVVLDGRNELGQFVLVLGPDLGQGQDGGSLRESEC